MTIEELKFTKEEIKKYDALSRKLFPGRLFTSMSREDPTELFECSIRQHTLVSMLAEMQANQEG
jgi:hypothetical protein